MITVEKTFIVLILMLIGYFFLELTSKGLYLSF